MKQILKYLTLVFTAFFSGVDGYAQYPVYQTLPSQSIIIKETPPVKFIIPIYNDTSEVKKPVFGQIIIVKDSVFVYGERRWLFMICIGKTASKIDTSEWRVVGCGNCLQGQKFGANDAIMVIKNDSRRLFIPKSEVIRTITHSYLIKIKKRHRKRLVRKINFSGVGEVCGNIKN